MKKFYGDNLPWGLGIVEDINDPLKSGRVRVRVFGVHSESLEELPINKLPWCTVVLPNTAAGMHNVGTSPVGLVPGSMVTGMFVDGDAKQTFMVMGTVFSAKTPVQKNTGKLVRRQKSNPEVVFDYLIDNLRYSEEKAAGVVGAIAFALNDTNLPTDKEYGGFGLGLWSEDERRELNHEIASKESLEDTSIEAQVKYLVFSLGTSKGSFSVYTDENGKTSVPNDAESWADSFYTSYYQKDAGSSDNARLHALANAALVTFGSAKGSSSDFTRDDWEDFADVGTILTEEELRFRFSGISREVTFAVLHHSGSKLSQNFSAERIDEIHRTDPNLQFDGIGYHIVIRKNGDIEMGRDFDRVGAHAQDFNAGSIGICLEGGLAEDDDYEAFVFDGSSFTFSEDNKGKLYSPASLRSLRKVVGVFLNVFPGAAVYGHYQTDIARGNAGLKRSGKHDPAFDIPTWLVNSFPDSIKAEPSPPAYVAGTSGVNASSDIVNTNVPKYVSTGGFLPQVSKPTLATVSVEEAPQDAYESVPDVTPTLTPATPIEAPQSVISAPIDTGGIGTEDIISGGGIAGLDAGGVAALISAALVGYATASDLQSELSGYASTNDLTWSVITGKPTEFTPEDHTQEWSTITSTPTTLAGYGITDALGSSVYTAADVLAKIITVDGANSGLDADLLDGQHGSYYRAWTNLTGVPSTFTPSAHNHAIADITNLQTTLDGKAPLSHIHAITDITGLQTALNSKAEASHTHNVANINDFSTGVTNIINNLSGAVNGLAPLDGTGKIPSTYIPAGVDDVLEAADYASLPTTGVAGKIYITLDNNKVYRWGGSTYAEISPSPGSTDAVPEGSVNLYFTNQRAQDALAGQLANKSDINHTHAIANVTGLQTALDQKLNIASYTAADVLTKLLTVDGPSSGLDADLLDGIQSSSFLRSDATDYKTGDLHMTNNGWIYLYHSGGDQLRINASGTSDPYLDVYNQTDATWAPIRASNFVLSSGATVWNSSNDGAGSTLDADFLDGVQGSGYLRSGTSDTMSGSLVISYLNSATNGHLELQPTSGALNRYSSIHMWGTFGATTDTGQRMVSSIRSGFSSGSAWGGEYWSVWLNSTTNDAATEANQTEAFKIVKNGPATIYGNTVWHAGNDGAGSGLDADTLDGYHASDFLTSGGTATNADTVDSLHASSFLRSDATDYKTGDLHMTNNGWIYLYHSGGDQLRINASGTANPYLDVFNQTDATWAPIRASNFVLSSGATVWNSSNDGAGSTLDADLLDGLESTSFLRSDIHETLYGSLTIDGGSFNMNLVANQIKFNRDTLNYIDTSVANAIIRFRGTTTTALDTNIVDITKNGVALHTGRYLRVEGSDVWHAGNDGPGSGLDADTLDGYHASALAILSNVNTFTNTMNFMSGGVNSHIGYGTDQNNYLSTNTNGATYTRALSGGSYITLTVTSNAAFTYKGHTIWHAGNDGSGTGLDADLLDGVQGADYFRTAFDNTLDQGKFIKFYHASQTNSDDGKIGSGLFGTGLNIVGSQTSSGTGRIIRLWGQLLDSGGSKYWHAGNDGSGSGLDSDTVDGYHATSLFGAHFNFDGTEDTTLSSIVPGVHVWDSGTSGGYPASYCAVLSAHKSQYRQFQMVVYQDGMYTRRGHTNWGPWVKYWTDYTDGAGSTLDADFLDGVQGADYLTFNSVSNGNSFIPGNYIGLNAYYSGGWKAKATQDGAFVFRNSGDGIGLDLLVQDGAVTADTVFTYNSYRWRNGEFYSGGNKYWHEGNDGPGSTLDADRLDGIEANSFLRSDVADYKTAGILQMNDNVNLNYGTGGDIETFCNGTHFYVDVNSGGWIYFRDGNTSNNPRFNFDIDTGDFSCDGNVTAYSDIRLKTNIKTATERLAALATDIRPVDYEKKRNGKKSFGVIAQEVKEVLPEVVMEGEDGILSVDYGKLSVVAIAKIQQQEERINKLEQQIQMLMERI